MPRGLMGGEIKVKGEKPSGLKLLIVKKALERSSNASLKSVMLIFYIYKGG